MNKIRIRLKAYDHNLVDKSMELGYKSAVWNADKFSSGLYFVKFLAGSHVTTQKLMLVK